MLGYGRMTTVVPIGTSISRCISGLNTRTQPCETASPASARVRGAVDRHPTAARPLGDDRREPGQAEREVAVRTGTVLVAHARPHEEPPDGRRRFDAPTPPRYAHDPFPAVPRQGATRLMTTRSVRRRPRRRARGPTRRPVRPLGEQHAEPRGAGRARGGHHRQPQLLTPIVHGGVPLGLPLTGSAEQQEPAGHGRDHAGPRAGRVRGRGGRARRVLQHEGRLGRGRGQRWRRGIRRAADERGDDQHERGERGPAHATMMPGSAPPGHVTWQVACGRRGAQHHPTESRGAGDGRGVRHGAGAARGAEPPHPVLRGHPEVRPEGFHGLQPHVLPDPLRLVRAGVRRPAQRRDALGRRGGALPGDLRTRRLRGSHSS